MQSDDIPGAQRFLPSDLLLPGGLLLGLSPGAMIGLSFDIEQLFPYCLSMPPSKRLLYSYLTQVITI